MQSIKLPYEGMDELTILCPVRKIGFGNRLVFYALLLIIWSSDLDSLITVLLFYILVVNFELNFINDTQFNNQF